MSPDQSTTDRRPAPDDVVLAFGNVGNQRDSKQAASDSHVLRTNEHMVVCGGGGSGKSALLQHILRSSNVEFANARGGEHGKKPSRIGLVAGDTLLDHPSLSIHALFQYHRAYKSFFDIEYAISLASDILGSNAQAAIGSLSAPQQVLLQLIVAVSDRPQLLLLDDPFRVLDQLYRSRFVDAYLAHAAEASFAALIVARDPLPFERVATRVGWLERGHLQLHQSIDLFRAQAREYVLRASSDWGIPSEVAAVTRVRAREDGLVTLLGWGAVENVTLELERSGAEVLQMRTVTPFRMLVALSETSS